MPRQDVSEPARPFFSFLLLVDRDGWAFASVGRSLPVEVWPLGYSPVATPPYDRHLHHLANGPASSIAPDGSPQLPMRRSCLSNVVCATYTCYLRGRCHEHRGRRLVFYHLTDGDPRRPRTPIDNHRWLGYGTVARLEARSSPVVKMHAS